MPGQGGKERERERKERESNRSRAKKSSFRSENAKKNSGGRKREKEEKEEGKEETLKHNKEYYYIVCTCIFTYAYLQLLYRHTLPAAHTACFKRVREYVHKSVRNYVACTNGCPYQLLHSSCSLDFACKVKLLD